MSDTDDLEQRLTVLLAALDDASCALQSQVAQLHAIIATTSAQMTKQRELGKRDQGKPDDE